MSMDESSSLSGRCATTGRGQCSWKRTGAGGPGEPEYEVEAIIGSRGRGARMKYKVKWLGWPLEQASWCSAAECRATCPERVSEYEQRELRRLQAVQIIRGVEVEKREHRARWIAQGAGTGNQAQEHVSCRERNSINTNNVQQLVHVNSLRWVSVGVRGGESLPCDLIAPVTVCPLGSRGVGSETVSKNPTENISRPCGERGVETTPANGHDERLAGKESRMVAENEHSERLTAPLSDQHARSSMDGSKNRDIFPRLQRGQSTIKCPEARHNSSQRVNGIQKSMYLVSRSILQLEVRAG